MKKRVLHIVLYRQYNYILPYYLQVPANGGKFYIDNFYTYIPYLELTLPTYLSTCLIKERKKEGKERGKIKKERKMAESPEQVLPPPPSPNHRGSCGRLLLDNLNLPPGTSTYRYQGRDYAESAMHGETRLFEQDDTGARSEYVVFTHVPPEEVICVPRRRRQQQQQKEEENKSQREEEEGPDEEPPSTTTLLKSRNFTYLEDGRILIVRMRTLSHERPKFQFDRLLITKLNNMGLGDKIDGRVGAAVQGDDADQGSRLLVRAEASSSGPDPTGGRALSWRSDTQSRRGSSSRTPSGGWRNRAATCSWRWRSTSRGGPRRW